MSIAKTLVLRACAVRARVFTVALDLQAVSVRQSTQSRPSWLIICLEYAVVWLKLRPAFRTQQMIALPREVYLDI